MTRAERDRPAALRASEAQQQRIKAENEKAGHTPGPWFAVGWQVEIADDNRPDICNTNPETFGQHGRSDSERCANARLIAAAPELLAALVMLLDAYEIPSVREQARAAIKKATGDIQ